MSCRELCVPCCSLHFIVCPDDMLVCLYFVSDSCELQHLYCTCGPPSPGHLSTVGFTALIQFGAVITIINVITLDLSDLRLVATRQTSCSLFSQMATSFLAMHTPKSVHKHLWRTKALESCLY